MHEPQIRIAAARIGKRLWRQIVWVAAAGFVFGFLFGFLFGSVKG